VVQLPEIPALGLTNGATAMPVWVALDSLVTVQVTTPVMGTPKPLAGAAVPVT